MKHDPEKRREPHGRGEVCDRPALHDGISWKEGHRQEEVFQEWRTSRHASLMKWVMVQKGMPVIAGIHLSVPFVNKEVANFGTIVRPSIQKWLEANQGSEIVLWQSPRHWRSPKQEKESLR